jgi:putative hydrolase of the HAD superfamily
MPIDSIIFDFWQTLGTLPRGSGAKLLADLFHLPIETVERARNSVEQMHGHDFECGHLNGPHWLIKVAEQAGQELSYEESERLFETLRGRWIVELQVYPGVDKLLKKLHADGWKLGLCSNASDLSLAPMKSTDFFELFDAIVLSCLAKVAKPDIEIFRVALRMMEGVNPEQVIYVGDGGSAELQIAKSLGMPTVLVLNHPDGHTARCPDDRASVEAAADFVIKKTADLPKILTQLKESQPV